MNAATRIVAPSLAKLREPFPDNQVSKLPKETRGQIDARKADKSLIVWKCPECGGAHHKNAVHLDYVGHAALTDRLLDTDPEWSWEPVAFCPDGLPALDRNGGLWIKLTVLGVTRLGYGDAEGKQGGNAIKEAIGDALRNAAMRFGAALDLWHKGDLHADDADAEPEKRADTPNGKAPPPQNEPSEMPDAPWAKLCNLLKATDTAPAALIDHYKVKNLRLLNKQQYDEAVDRLEKRLAAMAKEETNRAATEQPEGEFGEFDADDTPY